MKQLELSTYQAKQKRFKSYDYFGAHLSNRHCRFRVWAPNAQKVSLVGDFNGWNLSANPMTLHSGGIWETIIERLKPGDLYKYAIVQADGNLAYKADPYAFYSEVKPKTASAFWSLDRYEWGDQKWLDKRLKKNILQSPMNIYEVHLGSWMKNKEGGYLSFQELTDSLIPYLTKMHYTHIELMGIMEHPHDGSFGCQVSGYYAVTSRYGTPDDFMAFIDTCHQHGLSVIVAWNPNHFCKDAHGLYRFDGSHQYESSEDQQWGTMRFAYEKPEVLDFLVSNAYFWFDQFHIDGLRIHDIADMIQSNHKLDEESHHNLPKASERLQASVFLQEVNTIISRDFPFAVMAVEDSSGHPSLTSSVDGGGLGFNLKWNLEWTHNTLVYMSTDPYFRHQFHHLLTASLNDGFNENFILPLSHNEVIYGKKSILTNLFGDYNIKFQQFRLLYGYMIAYPGKKLSFMGNEFAPFLEWQVDQSLEWFMLEFEKHLQTHHYIKALNKFYAQEKALWINDHDLKGFKWLKSGGQEESILVFSRMSNDSADQLVILINFLPLSYEEYTIDVPLEGTYRLVFNSDLLEYGGSGKKVKKTMKTKADPLYGKSQSIRLTIPPSAVLILKKIKSRKRS